MTVLVFLILPSIILAAGSSVTQSAVQVSSHVRTLTFVCVGDDSSGAVANTDTNTANTAFIKGWYLYSVSAFPTSGGTAPDAADVMVYDSDGLDLLGSEDGGTTAYAGLTLVHATLKRKAKPNLYLPRAGLHVNDYPLVTGVLTVDTDNQATASAGWTIVLTFVR